MNNIDKFTCINLRYTDYIAIRNAVQKEGNKALYLTAEAEDVLVIPLPQKKAKDSSSNIVTNWMNDILKIINDDDLSEEETKIAIKTYCNSVKTTVNS